MPIGGGDSMKRGKVADLKRPAELNYGANSQIAVYF